MKCLSLLFAVLLVSNAHAAESMDLDRIVVTPTRYAIEDKNLPSYITVITPSEDDRAGARSIADLLSGVDGMYVSDFSSLKSQTVDIRGSGEYANRNVLVMVNGRKVNPVDQSGPDWLQISPEAVERIEIIRGAGTVLYGDNATSGVINIITKKGSEGIHGKAGVTFGSYGTEKESIAVSGAQKAVDYYMDWTQLKSDGYRTNSNIYSQNFNGRFGYKLSDQVDFDLDAAWHQDDYGLPGPLTALQISQKGRRATVEPENFGETKDRMVQLTANLDPWQEADLGKFSVSSSYRNRDTYAAFYSFGNDTKYNIDTIGITGKYMLERLLAGKQFNFVSGVDYYKNDNSILTRGSFTVDSTIAKNDIGIYGQGEYEVMDSLFLKGGTRFQKSYYTFDQRQAPTSYRKINPDEQATMAGVRYQYAPDSNVFADVQQTFRFLATDEWFSNFSGTINNDLKQQKGIQYQTGVKHNFADRVNVSVTPYYISNKNEIFDDPVNGTNNYDQTGRFGIELSQTVHLKKMLALDNLDRLDLDADYVYQHAKITRGPFDGKEVPWVPWHQWRTGILVGFLQHYRLGFDTRFVSEQYAIGDASNASSRIKSYVLCDTRLSYTNEFLELFGGVDNIFGQKYYGYVTDFGFGTSYYPAQTRSYTVGAKVKF